jgi:hypothetical protein
MSARGSGGTPTDGPRETASGLSGQQTGGVRPALPGKRDEMAQASRMQDDLSARASGSRHKKVTADKWNQ